MYQVSLELLPDLENQEALEKPWPGEAKTTQVDCSEVGRRRKGADYLSSHLSSGKASRGGAARNPELQATAARPRGTTTIASIRLSSAKIRLLDRGQPTTL